MDIANSWKDFKLLDAANGEKLEKWGDYTLLRPDPQVIWPDKQNPNLWAKIDAQYHRSDKGGGRWEFKNKLPEKWVISYKNLKFHVKTMGFKHTGLFPEQAVNWDWMIDKIKSVKRPVNVLNLFAYTGGATVACASAGASVCHIDAAKEMVKRAKENLELSGLGDKPVRFITDDVLKFVKREIRRNKKYDAILMDPPSFGRGPNGELWKLEDKLFELLSLCKEILSDKPVFFLINSYTTGFAPGILDNLLKILLTKKFGGKVSSDQIGLPIENSQLVLPCGVTSKWES